MGSNFADIYTQSSLANQISTFISSSLSNGSSEPQLEEGSWTIGLINSRFRYLSAETFGFSINCNETSMGKKQLWILEPFGDGQTICLRSHLNKYLAVDQFGNVTCDTAEKEEKTKFEISVYEDFSGRWAFLHQMRGYYLGGSAGGLICNKKSIEDPELWYVHLASRPLVNLRNVGRERFASLSQDEKTVQVDQSCPWGEETLFTLVFLEDVKKYVIHTSNNRYVNRDGILVNKIVRNSLFTCEYHAGHLCLRDFQGKYLSPVGSKAVLMTNSKMVTRDEMFSLEDALPQACFVAASNNCFISIKLGIDVTANQVVITNTEKFQLEKDKSSGMWHVRTTDDLYVVLGPGGGLQAADVHPSKHGLFGLEWQKDGSVCLLASNGKYVGTKKTGHLFANCDEVEAIVEQKASYYFYLINKPVLVLKCDQGFLGYKSSKSPSLKCNKATYDIIQVERMEGGLVYLKGSNGLYWRVSPVLEDGITCDSSHPQGFFLELREPNKLCIKATNGRYIVAQRNGAVLMGSTEPGVATLWQF